MSFDDAIQSYRAIIVGGGISGIAAAKTLHGNGIHPILLLEGSDVLGGRVRKYHLNDDIVIEQGANWIHGPTESNPIYAIGRRENIQGVVDEETKRGDDDDDGGQDSVDSEDHLANVRVRDAQSGKDLTERWKDCCRRFEEIFQKAEREEKIRFQESTGKYKDLSFREALVKYGWQPDSSSAIGEFSSSLEKLVEWYCVDYDYAESSEKLSVIHNLLEEYTWDDFGGGNFLVTDKRGFGDILIKGILGELTSENMDFVETLDSSTVTLTPGFDIKLRSVVVEVERQNSSSVKDDDPFQGDGDKSEKGKEPSSKVLVHLENGEVLSAEHVLITASIGVLQSDLIQFKPKLSKQKIEAINQIEMTCYMKCFLFWKKSWLDTEMENDWKHMLLANHSCGTRWKWPLVTRIEDKNHGGLLLMTVMVGDEGRKIESMVGAKDTRQLRASTSGEKENESKRNQSNEVVEEMLKVLRASFPECEVSVPDHYFISSWSQNRLFRGAYSLLKPGCPEDIFDELQRPEDNVWFAGEAVHSKYSGFLQGAFLSGIETADKIVKTVWGTK